MSEHARIEELLQRQVAYRVRGEAPPEAEELCEDAPEHLESLRELIAEYGELARDMTDPDAASRLVAARLSSDESGLVSRPYRAGRQGLTGLSRSKFSLERN